MNENPDDRDFILDPKKVNFLKTETGILNMSLDGAAPLKVYPICLFPLSKADQYISIFNSENKELGVIENLNDLSHQQRSLIKEELRLRYLIPVIKDIHEIKREYGSYKWETETDWGAKTFYVAGRNENISLSHGRRVIVTDIENCRYDIPDYTVLPPKALVQLEKVL